MDATSSTSPQQPPPASSSNLNDPNTTPSHKLDTNRRSSFNFLRRQKSTEGNQKHSIMLKKNRPYQYPPQQAVPRVPPQLPTPATLATMDSTSFIGADARQAYGSAKYASSPGGVSYTAVSPLHQSSSPPSYGVPMPPGSPLPYSRNGEHGVDPYARTESMTHRGRYSYASSAISTTTGINSPRRVRRRKDPTPFKYVCFPFVSNECSSMFPPPPLTTHHSPPSRAFPNQIHNAVECNLANVLFFLAFSSLVPRIRAKPRSLIFSVHRSPARTTENLPLLRLRVPWIRPSPPSIWKPNLITRELE
jgi:hypothetical protein